MGYVYRYTDLADNTIKYVGIVWSDNRTLEQRINEHDANDEWCKTRKWKIEYIKENINTRTDAEYFESHYISLYGTDKYFNTKKTGWGISTFLPERSDWKEFNQLKQKEKSRVVNAAQDTCNNKKYFRLDITEYKKYLDLISRHESNKSKRNVSITQYILSLIEKDKQEKMNVYTKLLEIENLKIGI